VKLFLFSIRFSARNRLNAYAIFGKSITWEGRVLTGKWWNYVIPA